MNSLAAASKQELHHKPESFFVIFAASKNGEKKVSKRLISGERPC